MMTKKGMLTIAAVAVAGAGIGVFYFLNKKKKQTNITEEDIYEHDQAEDIEENIEVDDDIVPETCDDINDKDTTVQSFMLYLANNNVDANEVASICETITRIKYELPEIYSDVKKKMNDMMSSEFDINKSHEFDKENFRCLYLSIDPCQLFIKNGFKILSMGPDCQEPMMNLAESLANLQEKNPDEAMTAIYELYHMFNDLDTDNIDISIYDAQFKPYVEKYVTEESEEDINTKEENDELNNEEE